MAIYPTASLCISAGDDFEILRICCNLSDIVAASARAVRDVEDIAAIERGILLLLLVSSVFLVVVLAFLLLAILLLAIVLSDLLPNFRPHDAQLLIAHLNHTKQGVPRVGELLATVESVVCVQPASSLQVSCGCVALPTEAFSMTTFSDRILATKPSRTIRTGNQCTIALALTERSEAAG